MQDEHNGRWAQRRAAAVVLLLASGAQGCFYAELGAGYLFGTSENAGAFQGPMIQGSLGFGVPTLGLGATTGYRPTPSGYGGSAGGDLYVNGSIAPLSPESRWGQWYLLWTGDATLGALYIPSDATGGGRSRFMASLFAGLGPAFANTSSSTPVGGVLSLGGVVEVAGLQSIAGGPMVRLLIAGHTGMSWPGVHGRPLLDGSEPALAPLADSPAWCDPRDPAGCADDLDAATRAALADAWREDGRGEHASVVSFARVSAQLFMAGAPPSLLEDAHRAALDEVDHARRCFSLATRYDGCARGPGPRATAALDGLTGDLAVLAIEALREGCLGEGVGAELARRCREAARDELAIEALAVIADDEARHAALAWEILAWSLSAGDHRVADSVAVALGEIMADPAPAFPEAPTGADVEAWIRHGRADPAVAEEVFVQVRSEVWARAQALPSMASRFVTLARRAPSSRRRGAARLAS